MLLIDILGLHLAGSSRKSIQGLPEDGSTWMGDKSINIQNAGLDYQLRNQRVQTLHMFLLMTIFILYKQKRERDTDNMQRLNYMKNNILFI